MRPHFSGFATLQVFVAQATFAGYLPDVDIPAASKVLAYKRRADSPWGGTNGYGAAPPRKMERLFDDNPKSPGASCVLDSATR